MKYKNRFGALGVLLFSVCLWGQAHTEVTAEDPNDGSDAKYPKITGTKTFTAAVTSCKFNGYAIIDSANACGWSGTDAGAWINSAKSYLGTTGGKIFLLPGSYSFSTQINLDDSRDITIAGSGGVTAGAAASTQLTYTGSTAPIISAKSTTAMRLTNFQLFWNNASFSGAVIDTSHSSGLGSDSVKDEFDHLGLMKNGSGGNASSIINLNQTISSTVHDNILAGYVSAIQGQATGGAGYANKIDILYNIFNNSTGNCTTSHIANMGQGWTIVGNTFEMGQAAGTCAILSYGASTSCVGCIFAGNWIGDLTAGATVTEIPLAGSGWDVYGNYIGGSANSTAIQINSGAGGVAIHGNHLITHSVGITFVAGTPQANIVIHSNTYSGVATRTSATSNAASLLMYDQGSLTLTSPVPQQVAAVDATGQTGNISATTLYAVPATAAGFYRVSCYAVVTTAATSSSTLPACNVRWTDKDSSAVANATAFTATSTGNTIGISNSSSAGTGQSSLTINAAASTNIQYSTSGYASTGGTAMQFAIHFKLEYLGN